MVGEKYDCACCGHKTLEEQDFYCICSICGWEDDPGQHEHPNDNIGANKMSLNEAKAVYRKGEKVI